MKKPGSKVLPLIASSIVPASALAGPGDLDPDFGTVGRVGPILDGPAWSLQPQADGTMILGGGRPGYSYYYWGGPYYSPPTAFVNRLSADGVTDPLFAMDALTDVQVLATVVQTDGKVVAVGRRYLNRNLGAWQLLALRLNADSSLDTSFAEDGLFALSIADHGERHMATAVVLDPDGRIVVAGTKGETAVVLRLLPDGTVDDAFGAGGIVIGPQNLDFSSDGSGARTSIIRAGEGGYRLTASNAAGCQLFALTSAGAVENAFGDAGVATAWPAVLSPAHCNALAVQPDGRLVAAGRWAYQGFVTRVLADGAPDPGFSAGDVAGLLADATSVAVGTGGSVVVGGPGPGGARVLRLQADGGLDAQFGDAGVTLIDLEYQFDTRPVVRDMVVEADGSILAAGGAISEWRAFVVRLLGDGGGDSPGVLSFVDDAYGAEGEGTEAVVAVRRSGGASGAVSVAYQLVVDGWGSAQSGIDYELDAGRLTWDDGDRGLREIRIPILPDDAIEGPETFLLELRDVEGSAGIGIREAYVEIPADGGPHGQIAFDAGVFWALEGTAVDIWVSRNYYAAGEVTVTLTSESGTATAGADFDAGSATLSWGDNELGSKVARIPIVNDTNDEPLESFTVRISNPTGGAIVGGLSQATVNIGASDRPVTRASSGGAGSVGLLTTLLLGVAALCRRLFRCRAGWYRM